MRCARSGRCHPADKFARTVAATLRLRMAALSPYELQRMENIETNHKVLCSLGLASTTARPEAKKRKDKPTCEERDMSRTDRVLRSRPEPVVAAVSTQEIEEEDLEKESEETEEEEMEEDEETEDSRKREEDMVEEEMEGARKRKEEREDARKQEEEVEASLPGGPKPRPSHVRRDACMSYILTASRDKPVAADLKDAKKLARAKCMLPARLLPVLVALGDDNRFEWSSALPEADRMALKGTCRLLNTLISAQVGLAADDRDGISEMLEKLPLKMRLVQALQSECCDDQVLDSLRDGARDAGVPLERRGRAALELMLCPEESLRKVADFLQDVCADLGPGLIPLGREGAIVDQFLRAHAEGRMLFVYKNLIPCADIYDLTKFANDPNYVDLDELFQRIVVFINAGASVSSGGGSRVNGTRVHIRQPLEGRRTTPGGRSHHLDSVGDKDVPAWVWDRWNLDRRNR